MTSLNLKSVDYDPKYYPRVNGVPNWITILQYTEVLKSKAASFPPIVVVKAPCKKAVYTLLDGLHRLRAYHKAGRTSIPAVIERIPQSKWFARSVELNAAHGRPLDTGDKAWIAVRLKEEGWDLDQVSGLLKMSPSSLKKMVSSRCVKITKGDAEAVPIGRSHRESNGSHYGFIKAPLINSVNPEKALAFQGSINSHDVLSILDSMIAALESGVVDIRKKDVSARVSKIKKLLRSL